MGYSPKQIQQWQRQSEASRNVTPAPTIKNRARVGTGDIANEKHWQAEMARLPGAFLAIRVQSESNLRSCWQRNHDRRKKQREHVSIGALHYVRPIRERGCKPWTVLLKRYGKNLMDEHDNLPRAFKACADEVSLMLGIDDGDVASVRFVYGQEKAKYYGIRIEIEESGNA